MGMKSSKISGSCTELRESINGISAPGLTVSECLRYHAEHTPNKNGFVFVSTDGSREAITWKTLYDTSRKMADFFIGSGIGREEIVAISMGTCPEWLYVLFGAILAGIRVVSLVFTYKDGSDVMAFMDNLKTCSIIFLDPDVEDRHWNILSGLTGSVKSDGTVENSKLTGLKRVIFRHPPSERQDAKTIQHILTSELDKQELPVVDENDVTFLFPTSGSTGVPKLAMHTHKSCMVYVQHINRDVFPYDDILFNDRPFMWIGGFPFNVVTGQTRVTTPSVYTSPLQRLAFFVDVVKKERCTSALLLPPLILHLMNMKDQFDSNWPLKTVLTGAMPVTKMFVKCVGTMCKHLVVVYACTEACVVSCLVVEDSDKFVDFSCGTQVPVGAIKIVDEQGHIAPINQRGEIRVKTEALFTAYFKEDDKTGKAFADGWFKTDDLGRMDEYGNLTVEGRKSDVIITGGMTVTPSILEAALKTCPDVENVAIVGISDDVMYQLICACVIKKPGSNLTESDMKLFCEGLHTERAGLFNVLPTYYLMMEKFPETYTGKVSKKELTAIATRMIKQ